MLRGYRNGAEKTKGTNPDKKEGKKTRLDIEKKPAYEHKISSGKRKG